MKKIVIYAKGKIFQKYYKLITNCSIIAIIDRNALQEEQFDMIPVYLPEKLLELKYDYVVIFSDKLFCEIFSDLVGSYFVDKEKIISWKVFLSKNVINIDYMVIDIIRQLMQQVKPKTMLYVGKDDLSNYFMSKMELKLSENTCFDKLKSKNEIIKWSIYDNVYKDIENCKKYYDIIFIADRQLIRENILDRLQCKYIIVMTSYILDCEKSIWSIKPELDKYGEVKYFIHNSGVVWFIKRDSIKNENSIGKIYVVTHKKYNVLSDNLYTPIRVGNKKFNEHWLSDSQKENIADLNEKINECTALYWIWKNTTSEIVGLNHYRRYFYSNNICYYGNFLNNIEIEKVLKEYDFILPKAEPFYSCTLKEQLMESIPDKLAFEEGYRIIKKAIEEKQKAYLDSFESVMESHNFYRCNMFVTRREILNEYCEWLFSFLIESAEQIDVSTYDNYSKRVIGFFAERMLTVWLYENPYRIKELPIALW